MSGPKEYRKGQALVARLDVYDWTDPSAQPIVALQIAHAQVHATLALAAATALNAVEGWTASGNDTNACEDEAQAWLGLLGRDRS